MNDYSGPVPCSYHPHVMTGLRCTRCGKPICPDCATRTDVGLRCPECAGVRAMGTIRTSPEALAKAALSGLAVAVLVAGLWRFFPQWQFYLALAMGFGVVEAVAWAANNKRGLDLQILSMILITIGFALSRWFLADRYGISWQSINDFTPWVAAYLQLHAMPDLLFMGLAYVISWIRFR